MNNHSRIEEDNLEVVKFLSELGPKPYSYEDLQIFTSKFSQHIGYGGYGDVYKGQFPNGVHMVDMKRRNGNGDNWFPKRVWEKYKNGQLAQLIKDCGIREKDSEKAKILSMVALWCAQYTPEIRPSMSDVVLMLQKKIPVDTPPYPFRFGQSLDSSVLPPTPEVIPEIILEISPIIDERQSMDSSVLPSTPEVIPEVRLEVSPTIDARQSLDSSVRPPSPEMIPEVRSNVHTIDEWQFWDSSVLPATLEVILEACLEVSPTIDESLLIKAGIVNPRKLPPPPGELRLEDHSKGSPTIDDSLLVKIGGSSSYISRKVGKIFGNEKRLPSLFRSLQTGSEGSVFFFDQIPQFKLKDLLRSTAEALGSGDFGKTYKLVLKSGDVVCVSSLEKIHDEENLQEKLHLYLGRLRHENLVSLKAYSVSAEEKLLIFEYMPNGSLFSILHSNGNHHKRIPLDWTTRLKFTLKVACGLFFIHHYSTYTYQRSHGNVKSTNVLIDVMGNPRLTDFGLSTYASQQIMKRPNGYRAPETLLKKIQFSSQEANIYAFGILLLEIVTGIWPCKYESYGVVDFPGMVQSVVKEEWMAKVFDLELRMYKHSEDEMIKLVQIAISCTSFSPNDRPNITSVMCMIEDIGKVEEGGHIKKYGPENIKKLKRTKNLSSGAA